MIPSRSSMEILSVRNKVGYVLFLLWAWGLVIVTFLVETGIIEME